MATARRIRMPLALLGLCMLGMTTTPGLAGLVDFSSGLLNHVSARFGKNAPARLYGWQKTLRDAQALPAPEGGSNPARNDLALLRRVNDFFNRIPYETDQEHWGMVDYWATPVEMLASNGGDCEDYAIAKYLSLKELGIPVERMRIAYVRALRLGENHMVLTRQSNRFTG